MSIILSGVSYRYRNQQFLFEGIDLSVAAGAKAAVVGDNGAGKTKQLIELINNAAKDEPGNVVCIEANRTMTYDIHYHIRLIDAQEYNLDSYELLVDGKRVDTPPKELELLYHLASTPNRVYTRNQLLDEVWGFDYFGDSRTVDVHIKRLREKLEGVSDQWRLKTVWGVGYKFEVAPAGANS